MNTASRISSKEITTDVIKEFFDKLLFQIEEDKNAMLLGTANEDKAAMYEKFISGDKAAVDDMIFKQNSYRVITNMFESYINELIKHPLPKKLSINFDSNCINVFAIVNDNDKEASSNLILAESSLIPKYFSRGFRMNTMIYEASEGVNIPKGYHEFHFPTSIH
jgi:hypothetical protein